MMEATNTVDRRAEVNLVIANGDRRVAGLDPDSSDSAEWLRAQPAWFDAALEGSDLRSTRMTWRDDTTPALWCVSSKKSVTFLQILFRIDG